MRFMMIVKADKESEAGLPPSPELMAAIGKLTEEAMESGVVLSNGGLLPSSKGARIRVGGGKLTVTDGPFAETKELIGGFAIIQANSRQEAIQEGSRFMQVHADVLGSSYEGELEVRQMYDSGPCGSGRE
ncbi:MAG: YciI family protein [Bryobacterales bacterium]